MGTVGHSRTRARIRRGFGALVVASALLSGAACSNDEPAAPTTSVTLPAAFPKADVPLVEGALIDAGERSQGGVTVFNVTVQAKVGGYDDAKRKLTEAGYLALGDGAPTPQSGTQSAQFSGKGYVVTVSSVADSAIPNAVFYSISKG